MLKVTQGHYDILYECFFFFLRLAKNALKINFKWVLVDSKGNLNVKIQQMSINN